MDVPLWLCWCWCTWFRSLSLSVQLSFLLIIVRTIYVCTCWIFSSIFFSILNVDSQRSEPLYSHQCFCSRVVFHCLRLDNTVKEWTRREKLVFVHVHWHCLGFFFHCVSSLLFMIFWRLNDVRTNNTNLILVEVCVCVCMRLFFFMEFGSMVLFIALGYNSLTIVRQVYWRHEENEKQSSCDRQQRWNIHTRIVCVCERCFEIVALLFPLHECEQIISALIMTQARKKNCLHMIANNENSK